MGLKKHEPIGAYAKFSVTKPFYEFGIIFGKRELTIVDYNKVVSRSLVFKEAQRHRRKGIKSNYAKRFL